MWVDTGNYTRPSEFHEHEHGWWNTMTLKGRSQTLEITTLHGITDGDKSSVNSSKAQYDRKEGKVTRAREIRDKILVELTKK